MCSFVEKQFVFEWDLKPKHFKTSPWNMMCITMFMVELGKASNTCCLVSTRRMGKDGKQTPGTKIHFIIQSTTGCCEVKQLVLWSNDDTWDILEKYIVARFIKILLSY